MALALRGGGLALLGAAWLMGDYLAALMPPGVAEAVPASALIVAMLMFAAGTMGTALLVLGGHLFDTVHVSARWAPQPALRRAPDA